jgi:hypothetical protein
MAQHKPYIHHIIAQEVSPQLFIAEARVRSRARSYGIYGRRNGTGTGFIRVLRFSLPILIEPELDISNSIIDVYNLDAVNIVK